MTKEFENLTDDDLSEQMSLTQPGAVSNGRYIAEFTRRQMLCQRDVAQAAKDTARFTQQNARYLLYSVIILAIASAANLGVSIANLIIETHHTPGDKLTPTLTLPPQGGGD